MDAGLCILHNPLAPARQIPEREDNWNEEKNNSLSYAGRDGDGAVGRMRFQ